MCPSERLQRHPRGQHAGEGVQSAQLPRNLGKPVVVLVVALGFRSVEMLATTTLAIRGLKVYRLAKVS